MLTISKPLSANQARTYHQEEFSNARDNYYTSEDQIRGVWHGQLALHWGLAREVNEQHFQRLAEGQDPFTGDQLVRHRAVCSYTNERGQPVKTMAHRAGWDATFSAPKSVSLTALVGGDARVRDAHRESVGIALDELEHYVQARLGDRPAQATGQWVAAQFEHDSARPVDGYAAPQLHTHVVVFNLTRTADGDIRPLQPRELYKSQAYVTAVYRAELAARLTALGYAIDRGASGQPEIRGYTQDYLDASSPRRQQIQDQLAKGPHRGAEAAEIAAHQTREAKRDLSHEEMQRRHQEVAQAFGHQAAHVVQAATWEHAQQLEPHVPRATAHEAVTFAKDRNLERDAVVDERALLRDSLIRAMGDLTVDAVKTEVEHRVAAGEFIGVDQSTGAPGRAFTTREMIALERDTIEIMQGGRQAHRPLHGVTSRELERDHPELNDGQRAVVAQILASRDRIVALDGVAGAGKTTALAAVRVEAERAGYRVEGLAPTSRAAQKLGESGIPSRTLQRHLTQPEERTSGQKRLYVLDESSLASTTQLHAFLARLASGDRVLLVGDTRQHQAVEAGRPYQQLQDAGMETTRLVAIVRQRDPALRAVVEQLARGDAMEAIHQLDAQGRVHEIADRGERLRAIAREYVRQPAGTLVVSPDNQSRAELNEVIHRAMQATGEVRRREHHVRVLVARQEVTGADRQWAEQYRPGDVVRYTAGSRVLGLAAGEYARIAHVDAAHNLVTVRRTHGTRITYDPRRLHGVALYRESDRAFAKGDRVQMTAPHRERHIANREVGTIDAIESGGRVQVRLDSGRIVALNMKAHPHLDYGYVVTSHSSQGQTADQVLVHIDLQRASELLVNRRLAYVAVSRGRHDAQIYTNDKEHLAEALNRDVSHRQALEPSHPRESVGQAGTPAPRVQHDRSFGLGR